jgi:beta-lactamase class A
MLPLLLTAFLLQAQPSPLESSLRSTIAASGAEVAVAYRTLDGRTEVMIDPDKVFHAASTMKVPVMMALGWTEALAAVRADDHGQQQLRGEHPDRQARRGERAEDGRLARR